MLDSRSKPPSILSKAAQSLWREVVGGYELDDPAGQMLLESALTAYDRMHQARRLIRRDGLLVPGTAGTKKQHPAVTIERDSRAAMLSALKALNLDLEPLRDKGGRPPGSKLLGTLREVT